MCGIYGVFDPAGIADRDRAMLDSLAKAMHHRGPDGGGSYAGPNVEIGMRRLSIIDLAHGMQPLWNERRTIALVANGEVYNFVELRQQLESKGHRFATGSDCETIVHLYEDHGPRCVEFLRGMFAFALVDIERRRMLIARDRLGEKPLYLAEQGRRMVFASELRALVASGAVPFAMDDEAIRDYFMWGFVPEPASAVVGTRKLGPGCLIELDLDSGERVERQWWNALDAPPLEGNPAELVRDVLEDIGRLVIRSDVPVGVALSGGVDSNLVAAMAVRHSTQPVHGFTVGYTGKDRHDETEMARGCARRLGIEHHCIRMDPTEVVADFATLCLLRDEPIADISGPGYLALMRLSRNHGVPVLLMGQGGDELFWGYPWTVQALHENERKARLLSGSAGFLDYVSMSRPPPSYSGLVGWLLGGFGMGAGLRALRRDRSSPRNRLVYWDQREGWWRSAAALRAHMTADFLGRTSHSDPARFFTGDGLRERPDLSITNLLLRTYLLGNGIDQCDRLSMAASVEGRLPLVDYRLVEVVIGLRKRNQDWRLPRKQWLLDAARDLVPEEVFRRRKRGFAPPWRAWYPAIFGAFGDRLRGGALCDAGILRDLKKRPRCTDVLGRPDEFILSALMLEEWARGMRSLAANVRR
jgi:asparagine synthase (glutamine-hydrolysing)